MDVGMTDAQVKRRLSFGETLTFTYSKPDGTNSTRTAVVEGVYKGSLRAKDADGKVKSFRLDRISEIK